MSEVIRCTRCGKQTNPDVDYCHRVQFFRMSDVVCYARKVVELCGDCSRNMQRWFDHESSIRCQVREFMFAAGQQMPEVPCVPDEKTIRLRLGLIVEEVRELTDALMDTDNPKVRDDIDLAEVADALADIDYVVEGMRNSFGINGDPIADEVHRANMDKFGPGSWKREDGKQMKPPDWKPPDIEGELRKQGWRQGDG